MPKATSQRQYRLFRAAASGDVKLPGLTRREAAEMVEGQSPRDLPERARTEPKRNSYRGRRRR